MYFRGGGNTGTRQDCLQVSRPDLFCCVGSRLLDSSELHGGTGQGTGIVFHMGIDLRDTGFFDPVKVGRVRQHLQISRYKKKRKPVSFLFPGTYFYE